jgi:hypothetical protein
MKFKQIDSQPYPEGYEAVPLVDLNTVLLYTRTPQLTEYIPIGLKVSEGFPCIYKNLISSHSNIFPFAKDQASYGCKKINPANSSDVVYQYDERFKVLDSYKKSKFYEDNDLGLLNNFPDMPTWSKDDNENMTLYYRSGARVSYDCIDNDYRESINNKMNDFKDEGFKMIIYSFVNLIILCIFLSVINIMKIGNKIQNILLNFIKLSFLTVFILLIILNVTEMYEAHSQILKILDLMKDEKCLDGITSSIIFNELYLDQYLDNWIQINNTIVMLCYPYVSLLFVQIAKFLHKTVHRIRNISRNKEAVDVLKQAINLPDIK